MYIYLLFVSDLMHVAKQRSKTDADFYHIVKLGEANRLLLTPEYLELKRTEAIASNSKLYYGPNIPTFFWTQDPPPVNKT